jgi:two-component system nitrate/nitrite response regulator NarL
MPNAARVAVNARTGHANGHTIDLTQAVAKPTRVLIAHEVRLFAEVLRVALAERVGLEVLPSIPTLCQAVKAARQTRPQVILMDIQGRTADGLEVLRELREAVPEAAILVVTSSVDPATVSAAVSAGASGFLTMESDMSEVVDAIRATAEGKVVLSGRRLEALVRHLGQRSATVKTCATLLTERERDVLALLVEGKSTQAIAQELGVSQNTARTHIQNVLTKLNVHSRLEAAARAVREHMV